MQHHIDIPAERIAAFCEKWNVVEFSLFGSVLREDFSDDSDIDVLVSFDADARITFMTLDEMEQELTSLFRRRVDLVTRRGIEQSENELRRCEILDHLQTVYRAA